MYKSICNFMTYARFIRKLRSAYYMTKCLFKPHNVVKMHILPREWCDRDVLMLHAIFQIIVDFVELEQPFVDWPLRYKQKAFTDVNAMKEYVESNYNTEKGLKEFHSLWGSEADNTKADIRTREIYRVYCEIIYLYEWYKNGEYDFYTFEHHSKTGDDIKIQNSKIHYVPNGNERLITQGELFEMEEEHDIMVDVMLRRALKIRRHLWT